MTDSTSADKPTAVSTAAPSTGEAAVSDTTVAAPIAEVTPASTDTSSPQTTEAAPADAGKSAPDAAPAEGGEKPADADTLLGGEKLEEKKEEPAEPEKTEPAPEPDKKDEPAEVPLPEFEEVTMPEGFDVDKEKFSEFAKVLGEFELTTKVPHEEVSKLAQTMLNRHVEEMKRYTDSLNHAWNKQKTDWKDAFLKDPEFSNRSTTAVNAAIDAISVYAGDNTQQQQFRDLMESTGIGNHPAMIRLLSNVMLAKAEPKPLAAPLIANKQSVSKIQKMYGNKK